MLTIQDQFIEETVKTDYKGNIENFIQEIKKLIRESKEKNLAKAYERGDLSTGEIAEKLGIHKEDVLDLLNKYDVYYADYNLEEEEKRIENFEKKFYKKSKV